MAITGVVAFRSIVWDGYHWKSPSRQFTWSGPVVWAYCHRSPECPVDEEGHIIIREGCACGIHGTLVREEFLDTDYMKDDVSVAIMVEALGHIIEERESPVWRDKKEVFSQIWAHTQGFTASGVEVVGVINLGINGHQLLAPRETERYLSRQVLAAKAAANFFGCKIISFETAMEVAKIMWEKHGNYWPY